MRRLFQADIDHQIPRLRRIGHRQLPAMAAALLTIIHASVAAADSSKSIEFNRDIRPILSENCFHCHGADANNRKAGLRLDTFEGATHQQAIVPGNPSESEVIKRIFHSDPEELMPPAKSNRRLTPQQKELLKAWIAQGGNYDKHWAFKAPVRSALPKVKQRRWVRNEIDHFILARLGAENLKPSPAAPTERLLRRLSLDLTGLPPDREQIGKWMTNKDPLPAAVDELLASSHFGERMAVDWMDVARYADTHGFNNDSLRSMWRWRDWVIDAFNRNLPYNRFITEQTAGDLLPNASLDQLIATGFNRNHVINSEGGIIDEEYRVEYVADRVRTTSMAWLGLTMECARCHDHKFDPISQKDFYRMFAFFNNISEDGEAGRVANATPIVASPTQRQQDEAAAYRKTMAEAESEVKKALAHQNWSAVDFAKLSKVETNTAPANGAIALDISNWDWTANAITNRFGGKPFKVKGQMSATDGPLDHPALVFNGQSSLKTDALPKFDGGKGWMFSAWIRRDQETEGVIFSSMDYAVPESSQSYGRGVEVRVRTSGAVDIRASRRWPGYSINVVTEDRLPMGQWRHLVVTSDGSEKAKGVRIFVDGQETSCRAIRDDFAAVTLTGDALLGASEEKNTAVFAGAMADVLVTGGPLDVEKLAAAAAQKAVQYAAGIDPERRTAYQTSLLQAAWLAMEDAGISKVIKTGQEARRKLLALEREMPTTMVMQELSKPRRTTVLFRGQYDQARDTVEPGVPEVVLPFPADAPRNRLGLANWLTDRRHPLTARVVVNRFWQSLFGTGIVKSVEDFGFQADYPSHPELLDWLAVEFMESGWDVKALLRLMVNSAAYRQDSASNPKLNERDPENRLLARGPRQRLTAEMLRDQALAVSGLLHNETGGPPVYPYQPANFYQGIVVAAPYPGTTYTDGKGKDLYRRSLYTFWKRTVPHPSLATFDAPDREVCVARRLKTNTPLQALASMNDTIQIEASRKLAERMLIEGGLSEKERIRFAFQLATARKPDSLEQKELNSLLQQRLNYYRKSPDAAKAFISVGQSKPNEKLDPSELAAYANVASLILNLDETITRN